MSLFTELKTLTDYDHEISSQEQRNLTERRVKKGEKQKETRRMQKQLESRMQDMEAATYCTISFRERHRERDARRRQTLQLGCNRTPIQ